MNRSASLKQLSSNTSSASTAQVFKTYHCYDVVSFVCSVVSVLCFIGFLWCLSSSVMFPSCFLVILTSLNHTCLVSD